MIKVVVGSKNPIKIRAVKNVFRKVFKEVEIEGIETESKVSHTPSSWEEIVQGAINRAKLALSKTNADFGVGLEGGYEKTKFGAILTGAVAIIDKKGKIGIGRKGGPLLPERIAKEVEKGKELGKVIDEIQGTKNTKQKWGAIGFLTRGHSNRQRAFEEAILYALARFLRKEIYE